MAEEVVVGSERIGGLKIKIFSGDEDQWPSWKVKFKAVLRGKKLLEHLKTEKPNESAASTVKKAWAENDEALFYELILHTSGTACYLIEQFEEEAEGKRAWETLVDKFEGCGSLTAVDLSKKLMTCTLDENSDPDRFFVMVEGIARRLKAQNEPVSDTMIRNVIIGKLPEEKYHALLTGFQMNKATLTYADVKEQIRAHWKRSIKGSEDAEEEAEQQKALLAAAGAGRYKNQGGGDMGKLKCYGCGKEGHKVSECRSKNPQQQRRSGGGRGADRGNRGGRGGGGYQRSTRRINGNCFKCGKFGHRAEDCEVNEEAAEQEGSGYEGNNKNKGYQQAALCEEDDEEEIALSVRLEERCSSTVAAAEQRALPWIVDSGCSVHMVNSAEGFTDIKWQKRRVTVAGGRTLEAVGIGHIKGSVVTDGGKNIDMSFNDVLLVPSLDRNLLSVARIVERGGEVSFSRSGAFISIKGMRLPLRACNRGDLYELEFRNNFQQPCKGQKKGSVIELQDQKADHKTMVAVSSKVEKPATMMESKDYKTALLKGLEKSDEPDQQCSKQRVNQRSNRGSRKKFKDGKRSQSSRSRRQQWHHGRTKPRQAHMAVDTRRGARRENQCSRGGSCKVKGCREWWATSKSMLLKRGAWNSVGDHQGALSEQRKKLEIDKEQEWASLGQRRQQESKPGGWNVVERYEGKRLKWRRSSDAAKMSDMERLK